MEENQKTKLEELYKEIIKFYFWVKELVINSERLDPEQRLSVAAINEFRSAFDHIARAHSVVFGMVDEKEVETPNGLDGYKYCEKNLDKACAHLYRAGYDAYDIISIQLRNEINKNLESFPRYILYQVMPNAKDLIIDRSKEANDLLKNAKLEKDVQNKKEEEESYKSYEKGTLILKEVLDEMEKAAPEMAQLKKDDEKRTNKQKKAAWIIGIVTAIVSILLTLFIEHLILK